MPRAAPSRFGCPACGNVSRLALWKPPVVSGKRADSTLPGERSARGQPPPKTSVFVAARRVAVIRMRRGRSAGALRSVLSVERAIRRYPRPGAASTSVLPKTSRPCRSSESRCVGARVSRAAAALRSRVVAQSWAQTSPAAVRSRSDMSAMRVRRRSSSCVILVGTALQARGHLFEPGTAHRRLAAWAAH